MQDHEFAGHCGDKEAGCCETAGATCFRSENRVTSQTAEDARQLLMGEKGLAGVGGKRNGARAERKASAKAPRQART